MIDRPLYLNRIIPFIDSPVIKIVTGVRRCGKSTLLKLVQRRLTASGVAANSIIDINLEAYSNRHLKNANAMYDHITKRFKARNVSPTQTMYLFLDEIQELGGWEQLIPGMMAEMPLDVYLTGSNAHFLSSEFATYLSGRYVEFSIYPFSFDEFTHALMSTGQTLQTDEAFATYIKLGGFPFLANLGYDHSSCTEYLKSIYDTVVLKDMVERENVRDAELLAQLLPFLIANVGHVFSARNVERMLKSEGVSISVGSVLKYIDVACAAHLLYPAQREDVISRKVFRNQEKYYLVDQGLREAVYGNNERNIDQVLENIVFLELMRYGWKVTVGDQPAQGNKSGQTGSEIDFIATKDSRRLYIQVAYLLAAEETINREFLPLESLRVDYPKYVLTMDHLDRSRNGITHMNIADFLLKAGSILG